MEEISIPRLAAKIPTEADAYKLLEEMRWHGQPVCPHCGSIAKHYFLTPKVDGISRETRMGNRSQRRVWKCKDCRAQFSVLTGTIMHGSKVPVRTWLFVMFEMVSSKNGVAAREVSRKYDLHPKTAWFLCHRIREVMAAGPNADLFTGVVVADESWIGGAPKNRHANKRNPDARQGLTDKTPIVTLVNKSTGEARSRVVDDVTAKTLKGVIADNVKMKETTLHTDSAGAYGSFSTDLLAHESVNHTESEYVRDGVSTNMAEGYFSQLKRSIHGTHHYVSIGHLPRYLAEFDFRYSTCDESDTERMERFVGRVAGRRLNYKPSGAEA